MPTSLIAQSFKAPSKGSSRSVSVSYDYSELDRQDKLREAANALDAKKADLLYKGDIGGMLSLNKQKEGLLSELAKPANVRLKSSSARSASDSSGPEGSMERRMEPLEVPAPANVPDIPTPKTVKKGADDLLFDMPNQAGNNSFMHYA